MQLRHELQQQPPTFLWRAFGFVMRRWYVCLVAGIGVIALGYYLFGLVGVLVGFVVGFIPFLYFLGVRAGLLPLPQ